MIVNKFAFLIFLSVIALGLYGLYAINSGDVIGFAADDIYTDNVASCNPICTSCNMCSNYECFVASNGPVRECSDYVHINSLVFELEVGKIEFLE